MTESSQGERIIPICGIGASAGGVKALQELFRELPSDLGLAYIVIVHLAPDHPSALSEILGNATSMPVHQVHDSPELTANCVYVIAPDRELVVENGRVSSRPFSEKRAHRAPIDMLFRSIARTRGDGMAVVLTGAGADGALGVSAVKEGGGVIFVQDPHDAEFPSMPHSAIATGQADFIAPIPQLAERIAEVARSKEAVQSLDKDGAANDLRRIAAYLHARTGHDFSSYKRSTAMRRVLRRMQVRRLGSLAEYAELLQEEPEEAHELFRDLLISVTQFFRDPEAFEALASEAIAPLLDGPGEEGIRVWVPACATGEEAYSIAILIQEEMQRRKVQVPVQIFATDLDDGALATAREGVYPRAIEADISQERLQQFFVGEGSHYRIRKEVREIVLFASHSVLKDPPFLRLDLISCRNLLIYLERSMQEKLCSLFAYGLRPNRFLFLGSAETADATLNLFTSVSREARIYRSKPGGAGALPLFGHEHRYRFFAPPIERRHDAADDRPQPARLHVSAIEQVAPPSILVDEAHHILHLSPNAGKYILHSGGDFSGRVSAIVRPELRLDLTHALDRAFGGGEATLTLGASVAFDHGRRRIAMNVIPVVAERNTASQALVLFMDGGPVVRDEPEDFGETEARPDEIRRLHSELKAAKEALSHSRREHELSVQELRAANEELQSINEEYRSTAEELETSKEELQSMNEELRTVNSELKDKLESISSAHSDLRNLTAATEIGTLFLDGELRLRMFTPPVAGLFNITEADVGRPLTDFTNRLRYEGVEADIHKVLRELTPVETEVESTDSRWFLMRIRPYRTIEDRIEGVVVTFVDISGRRAAEESLIESETRYRTLFESLDQGFCVAEMIYNEEGKPVDYRFLEVNPAFEDLTGLADPVGKRMRELEPEHEDHWFETYGRIALSGKAERFEAFAEKLGERCFEVFAFPFGDATKHQVGMLFEDISARKEAERERQLLTQELSHRVKNTLAVVQGLAAQTSPAIESVEEFRDSFIARLQALGRAHGLLLATHWQSADIKELVSRALDAYDAGERRAILTDGPSVELKPKQALGLALILHELSSNAVKYGALSDPKGHLRVSWAISGKESDRRVALEWRESDGPRVTPPTTSGFGTRLVERSMRFELKGSAELKFDPSGLKAKLVFPLA